MKPAGRLCNKYYFQDRARDQSARRARAWGEWAPWPVGFPCALLLGSAVRKLGGDLHTSWEKPVHGSLQLPCYTDVNLLSTNHDRGNLPPEVEKIGFQTLKSWKV